MRIGRARQRVTVQSLVETKDTYGQRIQTWTTLGTFWAFMRSVTGGEVVNGVQVKDNVSHFVQMRYIGTLLPAPGILPTMRLTFNGRVFNLLFVNNVDERNRMYELQAQEIASPVPT